MKELMRVVEISITKKILHIKILTSLILLILILVIKIKKIMVNFLKNKRKEKIFGRVIKVIMQDKRDKMKEKKEKGERKRHRDRDRDR